MIKRLVLIAVLCIPSFCLAENLLDINKADAETIAAELKGIGPAKAKAIVKYRQVHGPYKNVEELLKVGGIGKKTLERIRPQLKR